MATLHVLQHMYETHPTEMAFERNELVECIEACMACAEVCTICADACLGEPNGAHLVRCIRHNLDCADTCTSVGRILSRQTEAEYATIRAQLDVCVAICRICSNVCQEHAEKMQHCRICATSCRRCESACETLLHSLNAGITH